MTLKLGNLVVDSPKIVVTLSSSSADLITEAQQAYLQGGDILELRLDAMEALPTKEILDELNRIPLPKIFTARHPEEGGKMPNLTEEARLNMLRRYINYADAIDIELQAEIINQILEEFKQKTKIIISYHNLVHTPQYSYLEKKIDSMLKLGSDVCKIVTLIKNKEDLKLLIELCHNYSSICNLVVMGIGELSKISRIILPYFGSLFTYAYISSPIVEGQLSLTETKSLFLSLL